MKTIYFFLLPLFFTCFSQGAEFRYQTAETSPMVKFKIPWTFGTHEGISRKLNGQVMLDESDKVLNALFEIPINSMTTGNSIRDCHMREALGLNYDISTFPEEHVCNSKNQIPESGNDSIQYSVITAEFQNMTIPHDQYNLGIPMSTNVRVKINMHGVGKSTIVEKILITKTENGFNLVGSFILSLRDFLVQVKPVDLGIKKVGVEDIVKIQFSINLVKEKF